jgi:hypothetical protein
MNPDSNLARSDVQQIISINPSLADKQIADEEMSVQGGKARRNENQHVMKIRHQLEFYLGDSNLAKDRFLLSKL